MALSSLAMQSYSVFGGVLRSALPFPELDPAPAGPADWTMQIGVDVPERGDAVLCGEREIGPERYRLYRLADGFRLEYSHAGTFDLATPDNTVVWYPGGDDTARAELARSIVLGPVLALALESAGHFCLHGSAVALGDAAIAFVAPKHHGKSTLVIALARAGARFISDDTLAVLPGHPTIVRPGVSSARLWSDAARELRVDELCARVIDGVKTTATGFSEASRVRTPLPLDAVYMIQPERPDESVPPTWRTRLPAMAAAATLAQQSKLPDSLVGFAAAGARLGLATRIAATVPVYTLHVARSFELLPRVVQQLGEWHGSALQRAVAGR